MQSPVGVSTPVAWSRLNTTTLFPSTRSVRRRPVAVLDRDVHELAVRADEQLDGPSKAGGLPLPRQPPSLLSLMQLTKIELAEVREPVSVFRR